MITLDEIKNGLFADEQSKKSLLNAVRLVKGYGAVSEFDQAIEAVFFQFNEKQLQLILAPFLRSTAIQHVKTSPFSMDFRTQYIRTHGPQALDEYLNNQNKNAVYGADEEAKALADFFNVALKMTLTDYAFSYVAREAAIDRPIVHLYNQSQRHWFIYENRPGDTEGDGNCLYNSFAQVLRNHLLEIKYGAVNENERQNCLNQIETGPDVVKAFFEHLNVYQTQDKLRASFDKLPRRTDEQLVDIVLGLSPLEKVDHLHALESAVNDSSDNNSKQILLSCIQQMKLYGSMLKSKASPKGETVMNLALKLETLAQDFQIETATLSDFLKFKENFSNVLNSKNKEMSQYDVSWSTIVKNIAIALTGIGLLFIAGKLLYSQIPENRALFFFQNNKTGGEMKLDAVNASLTKMESVMFPSCTA